MTRPIRVLTVVTGLTLVSTTAFCQRVEETNTTFTFNGAWTPTTDANASGGAYTVSSSAGSTVTFSVTGNNFVLYRKVDPNGGYADVTVDGKSFGSITFYMQDTRWQIPAAIDQLGAGTHTIVLTVSPTQPTGSAGNNVYIDALENPIPATFGPTQAQQDAITRTNFYRNIIGIPPARHHMSLGLAADAHAKYLDAVDFIANNVHPHNETFGANPNFTGVYPDDRDHLFGFTSFVGSEDSNNSPDPIGFVDGWMDGVYHRQPYLVYSYIEAGFGGYPKGSTMDFASSVNQRLLPAAVTISTYPADNQTDVWPAYDGSDGPSNVQAGGTYGYPISLTVSSPDGTAAGTGTAAPTTGTIADAAGNAIATTIADYSIDKSVSHYFLIPNQPLALSTTYTVHMTGTDPLNNLFDKTWKFTTANPNAVHAIRTNSPSTKTFIYSVRWDMAAAGIPSQLEYGPTTAYGSVAPGVPYSDPATFQATLPGLITTAGITHYRVTAKDAQGNVYASADHVFNIVNPTPPATVGFVKVRPAADNTSMQWETAGAVASSQVNYGLDTTYGATQAGRLFSNATTQSFANLANLTSGATYHYQIVATDMLGNVFTSPDATFVIP